jgi:YVTN family beta-propeller protein
MKILRNMMIAALMCSGMVSYGATVAVTPDGSKSYEINEENNSITVIDLATNTEVGVIAGVVMPIDIRINPNGVELYVLNDNHTVTIIDVATDTITETSHDVNRFFPGVEALP